MYRRAVVILTLLCLILSSLFALPAGADDGVYYTVQWGDALSAIAWRYRVTVEDILKANDLTNANVIYAGQKLAIPVERGVCTEHVVAYSENLLGIAWKYDVSYWDIMVRNDIANPNLIYVGQRLLIPTEGSTSIAPGTNVSTTEKPSAGTNTQAPGTNALPPTEGLDPLCILQEEIVITAPLPEEEITSPVLVTGCTRQCCALAVDILDSMGVTIGQGYVLVDANEDGWGPFSGTIEFTRPTEKQLGRIQVYRISTRDGAIEHLNSVPVVLMP